MFNQKLADYSILYDFLKYNNFYLKNIKIVGPVGIHYYIKDNRLHNEPFSVNNYININHYLKDIRLHMRYSDTVYIYPFIELENDKHKSNKSYYQLFRIKIFGDAKYKEMQIRKKKIKNLLP